MWGDFMEAISNMYALGDLEKSVFIIKTFFIILYTYLCNFKFTNQKIKFSFRFIGEIFIIGIIALICSDIRYEINYFMSIICMIGMISIIFSRVNKDIIGNSILITTLSITINYIMFIFQYKIHN